MAAWTLSFESLIALVMRLAASAGMPLAHDGSLPERAARGVLGVLVFERGGIDLAAHEVGLEQLVHLAQAHVVVGEQGENVAVAVDPRLAILEVVPLLDLSEHALHGVLHFCYIGAGDDVEGWHALPLFPFRLGSLTGTG